jgi:hypothetical protein
LMAHHFRRHGPAGSMTRSVSPRQSSWTGTRRATRRATLSGFAFDPPMPALRSLGSSRT